MALNKIYAYTQEKTRERQVPANTQSGTPLVINTRPCVTITARGDATRSNTVTGITVSGPVGGVGNLPDSATVAFDGTWEFAVTGATTSTGQDVAVYLTTGGTLTLTVGTNTLYGYTDYPRGYTKVAGRAPVRIGV
jgi:hypothetical protein